jgi:RIO kinase 1
MTDLKDIDASVANETEELYQEEYDDYDDYDDYLDDELNDTDMWDNATGGKSNLGLCLKILIHYIDFTKQYNKLRQQIAPAASSDKPAPAVNKKIAPAPIHRKNAVASEEAHMDSKKQMLESQIDSLGHFASRIHIGEDYNPAKISSSVASDIKLSSKKASGDK